ncbi:MAG: hypothetical protein ABIO70_17810 [Pseudomonadota bacterium]
MTGVLFALLLILGVARGGMPVAAVAAADVPALRLGLPLVVSVLGGERLEGAFVAYERDRLVLSTREGQKEIGLPLILSVEVEGSSFTPEAFVEGVRRWSEAQRLDALSTPPPVLVGGASVLWAGAGPAMLGRWDSFLAYSIVEGALLGAGAVMVARGQYGPLLPLAALDVLVHGWAAGDSVHEARRRRRRANALVGFVPFSDSGDGGFAVGFTLTARGSGDADSASSSQAEAALPAAALTAPGPFPY